MLSKYPHLAALAHEGIPEEQPKLALFRIGIIQKLRKQQVGCDGNISGIHGEAAVLSSIFDIADRVVFLDAKTKRQTAIGAPRDLLEADNKDVRVFLNRGVDPLENKDIYEK